MTTLWWPQYGLWYITKDICIYIICVNESLVHIIYMYLTSNSQKATCKLIALSAVKYATLARLLASLNKYSPLTLNSIFIESHTHTHMHQHTLYISVQICRQQSKGGTICTLCSVRIPLDSQHTSLVSHSANPAEQLPRNGSARLAAHLAVLITMAAVQLT